MVQAQDNGQPSLSTTITVYCNVLDLNDNAPVFDPLSYSQEIYENVTIGTPVLTVMATDHDSGKIDRRRGAVYYKLQNGLFLMHDDRRTAKGRNLSYILCIL